MSLYKESPYRLAAGDIAPPARASMSVIAPSEKTLAAGGARAIEPRSFNVTAIEATALRVGETVTLDTAVKPAGSAAGEIVIVQQEHVQAATSLLQPVAAPELPDPVANLTILTEEDLAAIQANREQANQFAQDSIAAQTAAAEQRAYDFHAEQEAILNAPPQAIDYAPPDIYTGGNSVPIAPVAQPTYGGYSASQGSSQATQSTATPYVPQVTVRYIDYYDDETGTMQSITQVVDENGNVISEERT